MMRPDAHAAVYVCVAPVDMRKQAATLALIVEQTLKKQAARRPRSVYLPTTHRGRDGDDPRRATRGVTGWL